GTGRSAREVPRHPDPDYPQTLTYPTETFASDAELRIAGLTLRTADFGPGESATATVHFEPASRALFGPAPPECD
ncbi:MAG TPA: hypothetical protein VF926_10645, partial [Mycobacterium sp.]